MSNWAQGGQNYGDQGGYDDSTSASQVAGQGGFAGTQSDTSVSPRSPKSQSGAIVQTLTPVTIRQLFNAIQSQPEDVYKVDGKELNQITIVGQIVSSVIASTNIELVIDDGTGKIDVRHWVEMDDNQYLQEQHSKLTDGTYVRVIGHLRALHKKRNIMAFRIQPLEDLNELTFHLLEVIQVHLFNTKGPLDGPSEMVPVQTTPAPQFRNTPVRGHVSQGGTSVLHNNIIELVRTAPDTETGVSINDIVATLSHEFSEHEIRQAVGFLSEEGHLYSTIDDEHFKAPTSGQAMQIQDDQYEP